MGAYIVSRFLHHIGLRSDVEWDGENIEPCCECAGRKQPAVYLHPCSLHNPPLLPSTSSNDPRTSLYLYPQAVCFAGASFCNGIDTSYESMLMKISQSKS